MSEIEFRRRCFLVGGRVMDRFNDALSTIDRIKEGKTVLPKHVHKDSLKSCIDSIKTDLEMSQSGFEDGYPPCLLGGGEIQKSFEQKLDEAYISVEKDEMDRAKRTMEDAKDQLRWMSLNIRTLKDMEELEFALKNQLKGKKLPWER
jgi:hypothetical protein